MSYKILLIFFSTIVLNHSVAWAGDERYRVEVLVLTHLHHGEPPVETSRARDYSGSLDFLAPESDEEDAADEVEAGGSERAPGSAQEGEPAAADGEPPEPDPNAVVHLTEMSPVMADAWRRLRLSAPFRPEQYLAWEQGSSEPFPLLRVHDPELLWTYDAYAALRALLAETEIPPQPPVPEAGAEAAALEPEAGDGLPEPRRYYRLDGTVQLRRSRFLHLDLDLELREAIFDETPAPAQLGLMAASPRTVAAETGPHRAPSEAPAPSSYRVYRLEQSRQVKTGQLQYFDTPVLGVLAYITTLETEAPEEGL